MTFCNTLDYCDLRPRIGRWRRTADVITLHFRWRHRAAERHASASRQCTGSGRIRDWVRVSRYSRWRCSSRLSFGHIHLKDIVGTRARFDLDRGVDGGRSGPTSSAPPRHRPIAVRIMSMRTSIAPSMPSTICSAARRSPRRRHCRCRVFPVRRPLRRPRRRPSANCIAAFLGPRTSHRLTSIGSYRRSRCTHRNWRARAAPIRRTRRCRAAHDDDGEPKFGVDDFGSMMGVI